MDKTKQVKEKHKTPEFPKFGTGDTVEVHVKIKEEGKTRIQVFEGVVIKRKGSGSQATFTVRRVSYGEGVERTFQLCAPSIEKVKIKKKGSVRRAKLYYLRKRKGKKSKVEEKIERQTPSDALPRTEGA
ncbi:MAG: 50S ribosomal protein L19 [Candidatus Omnitrophica bacterium]|nr:50S ribosomal protein L19 [Candidatus Omnitrophota bacterium]